MIIKRIFYALFVIALLSSCGGDKHDNQRDSRAAKGNVYYGGVFRMNEIEDFRNLFPLNITEVTSQRIATQIYEGLVKLSQANLSVIPAIAESWDINSDATEWTFHIRKGVKFHDDPCFKDGKGREVTANDFKYCFTKLCESNPENQLFGLTFQDRVVGANEYYESTVNKKPLAEGVTGVKVIDDYTLQINLKYPFAGFLNILSHPGCWLFPKEAVDKYGVEMRIKCVGTGPFKVKSIKEGDAVILERNENYWGVDENGNKLPYLDAVRFSFIKEKKSELLEFKSGKLDMIYRLPIEMIPEIMGDLAHAKESNNFELQSSPAMSLFYYGFQHQSNIFNKKEVRQAFNYAIDREKIVTYTLQGEGIPGIYGIVPPSFKDYDTKAVKGYTYDPEKARMLLQKAGFGNGKGFPKPLILQINSGGGDRNIQTAEVIQKMLKENLNIDVDINVMQFAEHLETLETGKALFWRTQWSADYPDPETFLTLLYSKHIPEKLSDKSYINSVRYKSAKFDSLFEAALREIDTKKRFDLYRQADQVAMDDAAIMPIFYDENYRLIHPNVKNFDINAMEYRDLTRVYLEPEKEAKK